MNKQWKQFFDSFLEDTRWAQVDYKMAIKNLESENSISHDIVRHFFWIYFKVGFISKILTIRIVEIGHRT